jgi:Domain of unknown function (DUF389).
VRQITITAPAGTAQQIAEIAFSSGIARVALSERRILEANGTASVKDCVEIDSSTPAAKAFLDRLTSQPFFTRAEYSVAVRQPRALISREPMSDLTLPLVEPAIDVFEELWQFSQVTYGFVARIFIGGLLLAYGLVEFKLLFMIAGLLFIPLLPLMLSIGFGLCTRQWRLARQGLVSLVVALVLLVGAGLAVGLLTSPPVRYSEFNSLLTGVLVSIAVGVAAGLATADDVGRREMIGLAATAQVAIVPTWLGLCLILGFPLDFSPLARPFWGLLVNVIAIVIASLTTYALIRIKGSALTCYGRDV